MKRSLLPISVPALLLTLSLLLPGIVCAYPAASLEGRQPNCLSCHLNTGPWEEGAATTIDIIDPVSRESFAQDDGTFLISVKRNQIRRVETVFVVDESLPWLPECVGWLYVDPQQLESAPESSLKFGPFWEVNRPFCGKRLNTHIKGYDGKIGASLTMSLRPLEGAKDASLQLQVLFKPSDVTLVGNYYERTVILHVEEDTASGVGAGSTNSPYQSSAASMAVTATSKGGTDPLSPISSVFAVSLLATVGLWRSLNLRKSYFSARSARFD